MVLKMEKTLAGMMALLKGELTDVHWVPWKDLYLADSKVLYSADSKVVLSVYEMVDP